MQNEWASWLLILFFALLPFGRFAELPLAVFALCLPFILRTPERRLQARSAALVLVPLFLCFWLPMVLSSFDSFEPQKSTMKSLAALRYLAAAISIAVLLSAPSARWRVLRWTSFLLLFWAIDGFVQLYFGADLFGVAMHPERLNALFIRQYQFFGPTLAILSPLLLEYARRRWPPWAWAASFSLILGAVMIAGMRSGWLIMGLVMAVYLLQMMNRENRDIRLATISIPVLALGVIIAGYLASPLIQDRVEQSLKVLDGTPSGVDTASSARLPIFKTAWSMYQAHPVNGVGVRAFSTAYLEYAEQGDIHVRNSGGVRGALHAHNLLLEVAADTGTIGILCLAAGLLLAWRQWRSTRPKDRQEAFPYVLAIGLLLFPVNSHFAIYGTYLSSLIWMLAGLWVATLRE
ncbi:MAG: O-antigen ligase family protein [Xanthomonadales bacterium]|nr:O-antigen ligase family protein [Xanthomonadales bacterium]